MAKNATTSATKIKSLIQAPIFHEAKLVVPRSVGIIKMVAEVVKKLLKQRARPFTTLFTVTHFARLLDWMPANTPHLLFRAKQEE